MFQMCFLMLVKRIFFSIIIPYLEQTILVIWTIITILVLKIFDIIFAMTNGEWQTGVLANLMYDWMFRGGGDSGRGSVLAFVIMIGVKNFHLSAI